MDAEVKLRISCFNLFFSKKFLSILPKTRTICPPVLLSKVKDEVIYFGPMGCRTGFYLILKGNRSSKEIFNLVNEMNEFCIVFEGKIPGEDIRDCGNYLDLGLDEAKKFCIKYKEDFLLNPTEDRFIYSK